MAKKRGIKKEKKRSKLTLKARLLRLGLVLICVYFAYSFLSLQIQIYKEKQTLEELQRQIDEQRLENDELMRLLADGNEEEYMERVAREKGWAGTDEEVFEAVGG